MKTLHFYNKHADANRGRLLFAAPLLLCVALSGCSKPAPAKQDLRALAAAAFAKAITNDVTGYNRTIDQALAVYNDQWTNWSAEATVNLSSTWAA